MFTTLLWSPAAQRRLQFKASVAKPWTKLKLRVYTCNYHPGTVLSGSWHPKHRLPGAFLITLITADSFCSFTSDYFPEQASGKRNNAHTRLRAQLSKQNLGSAPHSGRHFRWSEGCTFPAAGRCFWVHLIHVKITRELFTVMSNNIKTADGGPEQNWLSGSTASFCWGNHS